MLPNFFQRILPSKMECSKPTDLCSLMGSANIGGFLLQQKNILISIKHYQPSKSI